MLDCTCGIGTQALPLAAKGFRVTASDLSEAAVARARGEARERGIDVRFGVADVRALPAHRVDAVISCDNSLPHLLTDADLAAAVRSVRGCLGPGGLFLASTRDYDAILRDGTAGGARDGRRAADRRTGLAVGCADGRTVEINIFFLRQRPDGWAAAVRSTPTAHCGVPS